MNSSSEIPPWLSTKLQEHSAALALSLQAEVSRQVKEYQQEFILAVADALKEPSKLDAPPIPVPEDCPPAPLVADTKAIRESAQSLVNDGKLSNSNSNPNGNNVKSKISLKIPGGRKEPKKSFTTKMQKLRESKQPPQLKGLQKIVTNQKFELISGAIIVLNTLTMALMIQYQGLQSGYELSFPTFEAPASETWPGAEDVFEALEGIFTVLFLLELVIRIAAWKLKSFRMGWMWFDTIIVTMGTLDYMGLGEIGLDPSMMRLLRLARLIRMLKLLQALSAFESLFVLIRSIRAGLGALVWSFFLLLIMQGTMALLICQLLANYYSDDYVDSNKRREVFGFFGTFSNAMLSMFEISLANWVPICRLLFRDVHEWYGVLFVLYRCMLCFAVVKVITAVFISETNKAAAGDMDAVMMKKQKEREQNSAEFREMFQDLDTEGRGLIYFEQFEKLIQDEIMQAWFRTLEFDPADLELLFRVYDNGEGYIKIDEFIDGIVRMSGPPRSMDVIALLRLARMNQGKINTILDRTNKIPPPAVSPDAPNMTSLKTLLEISKGVDTKLDSVIQSAQSDPARGRQDNTAALLEISKKLDSKLDSVLQTLSSPPSLTMIEKSIGQNSKGPTELPLCFKGTR
eukprot:gnl/TRDRNA2_/TRDRNA2_198265_c0_seq1.p1 gnl/TRDRNA2_/TRDRNA2_198265_c0~~gnl/TRDRNA2_/TRDRNA2_198265_c0_seq1.p1  ORF type:complete len:629 (-),score=95.89 gnl/TRDRNA2_/TRDRNA2_198265_c0_seq1:182-2068(-)